MAILTEEDRLSYRIVFLVAIVILLAVPVTAVRLFAAAIILCYLPAAPFAARAGTSFLASLALTVAVSPFMIGLPIMLVMLLGLPVFTAVWAIVGIAMAQFLVYGTQRALVATRDERRLMIVLAAIVAAAALLSLWLPVTNTWWRIREDSWFHAAVFYRVAHHGLPVIDPYFSPLRLQYMYFYHILLLTVSTITGLGPFTAMIFTNLIALGACVLGVNFLVGFFARRATARVLAVILCIFGMNGLFYLFFPIRVARAFLGESTGTDLLRHFFSLSPPGHEAASRFLSIEGNQFMFLNKFMLGTAFSLTLGLTCVILALLVLMRTRRWNWLLTFFYIASLSGVIFLHLIMGATVVAATVGTILVMAIAGRGARKESGQLTLGKQAIFTAFAVAITIPYVMSVLPQHTGVERSIRFALQAHQVIGIIAGVFAVLIPAVWYLTHRGRERLYVPGGGLSPAGVIAVWAAFVLVAAFVVDLPTTNESKFVFPLQLALTALAAGALDKWLAAGARSVGRTAIYVLACTVPLNAVYFWNAFADDQSFEISPSEQSLYEWIQKTTDEEALFLEANDMVRIPVLAERDQYWGNEVYAVNWGYPDSEMNPRRALRDAVFGDCNLDDRLLAHARSLDRPMYVVLRDIHSDGGRHFRLMSDSPYLAGKFMTENNAVFQLLLLEPDEAGSR
jgi:hypothetical protein